MSKAAASDFIKQVTAAEAETQRPAAHSPCSPPPSSSPRPLEAHILSREMGRGSSRSSPGSTRDQEDLGREEGMLETLQPPTPVSSGTQ